MSKLSLFILTSANDGSVDFCIDGSEKNVFIPFLKPSIVVTSQSWDPGSGKRGERKLFCKEDCSFKERLLSAKFPLVIP